MLDVENNQELIDQKEIQFEEMIASEVFEL